MSRPMTGECSVRPDALTAMSSVCTHAEHRCRASARAIDAAPLPPDAFGGTTHSALISGLADEFRIGMHARVRSSAEDAQFQAGALETVARDFRESDRCAARGISDLTTGLTAPSQWQPGPQERLVGPARLVP
ncbi:MAG: hypothetical protein ACRCYQ_12620 [Nocardioides sp.]